MATAGSPLIREWAGVRMLSVPMEISPVERDAHQQSLTLEVANEIVRLYKELLGRGPTKAAVMWAGPDTLICTLRKTFTPAEVSLAEMGEGRRLRETRLFFHDATEQQFNTAVERIVGRPVVSFTSGLDPHQDIVTAVFYLGAHG